MRPLRRLLSSLALLAVAACGGGDGPTQPDDSEEPDPVVTTVSVSPGEASADALDATVAFSATARDQDGNTMNGVSFTWSSADPDTATVAGDGTATAVANGTARIVAEADGVADTATLTVDQVVDSVAVSPGSVTLDGPGDTVRIGAEARDGNDHLVVDATFSWATSDPSVATVDGDGLVTAEAEGTVQISATAESLADTARVGVGMPPQPAPSIASVSPSPLQEGGSATISGSDFDTDASDNTVTIGGVQVTVTAATATSLDVSVPTFDCLPARDVAVTVQTPGGSDQATESLAPDEAPVSLAAGQQLLVENPADFCLQFEASTESERYLVGVQSLSGTAGSLTPVTVTSEAADGSGTAMASRVSLAVDVGGDVDDGSVPETSRLLEAHREAEMRHRAWEVRNLDPAASLPAGSGGRSLQTTAIVDGSAQVGDTVALRVPDGRFSDLCANYVEVGGVVKAIGTQGIFVADTANPSGGFTDADYQDFSDRMDVDIFSTLIDYFGSPTDLDGNGRVVVLISKEVNVTSPTLLGFVWQGDLFPRSTTDGSFSCASSDEGELYYGRAPDPNGTFGDPYSTDVARSQTPFIMSHELTHVIQSSRRFDAGQPFMSSIIAEGQATLSEEVVGHSVTGRATGQNYGYTTAFNADGTDEIDWYSDGFIDLTDYFGFESSTTRVEAAPEECGWWREDPSPCASRPLWYGVSWAFLRWASDQYGPGYTGGEQGFHRDLIGSGGTGPENVASVLGQSFEEMMARWAASLYVDDRVAAPDPLLTFTSWDLFDVEQNTVSTAHLQPLEVSFTDWVGEGEIRSSSAGYIAVESAGRPATAIRIRGSTGGLLPADMQVWVVRLQ